MTDSVPFRSRADAEGTVRFESTDFGFERWVLRDSIGFQGFLVIIVIRELLVRIEWNRNLNALPQVID